MFCFTHIYGVPTEYKALLYHTIQGKKVTKMCKQMTWQENITRQ